MDARLSEVLRNLFTARTAGSVLLPEPACGRPCGRTRPPAPASARAAGVAPLNHRLRVAVFSLRATREKFSPVSGNVIRRLQLHFCTPTPSTGSGRAGPGRVGHFWSGKALKCATRAPELTFVCTEGCPLVCSRHGISKLSSFQHLPSAPYLLPRVRFARERERWCGRRWAATGSSDAHWSLPGLSLQPPPSHAKQAQGRVWEEHQLPGSDSSQL